MREFWCSVERLSGHGDVDFDEVLTYRIEIQRHPKAGDFWWTNSAVGIELNVIRRKVASQGLQLDWILTQPIR